MKKWFLALITVLVVTSFISAGIADNNTIKISPRSPRFGTNDLSLRDTAAPDESNPISSDETETPPSASEDTESGIRYILNKSSKRIHYPDCAGVKQMKESNKIEYVGTVAELTEMGYVPCGTCKPQ